MAKCVQNVKDSNQVKRVDDAEAAELTATKEWRYISKFDFKRISGQPAQKA